MTFRPSIAATLLAVAASGASAQSMKPGLWEINNQMQMGAQMGQQMAQMQQQLAGLAPEQRRMIEEMMAKQGLKLGAGGPGAINLQVCVTPEMAARDEIPAAKGDCRNTVSPRSGNILRFSFVCTAPPSSGEGQVTFVSPEAYTMKMTVNAMAQGKAEKISLDGTGKWLAADCGSVKPGLNSELKPSANPG